MENIYKAKLELIESIERMRFTNLDEENFEKETRQKKAYKKEDYSKFNQNGEN